jgi:very-short-patch-repair endonuclease
MRDRIGNFSRRGEHKTAFARRLREQATDAERQLWTLLRARRLGGFKFRRQQPMGPYVVDFVCSTTKLVVELDGGQHSEERRVAYDEARTAFLNRIGYSVLRITNHEFFTDRDAIIERIWQMLKFLQQPSP